VARLVVPLFSIHTVTAAVSNPCRLSINYLWHCPSLLHDFHCTHASWLVVSALVEVSVIFSPLYGGLSLLSKMVFYFRQRKYTITVRTRYFVYHVRLFFISILQSCLLNAQECFSRLWDFTAVLTFRIMVKPSRKHLS